MRIELSTDISSPTTASIDRAKFAVAGFEMSDRRIVIAILIITFICGFCLRVANLGVESLGEDELNKLQTVTEYRENGLSGRNGEHPFLMKGLQTLSVTASETWNKAFPQQSISTEAALRFPTVLFGSLLIILLYLLVNQLFGSFPALVTAVLYAVTPSAIAFDRIAKEDTFLLFFFVLANVFWMREQTLAQTSASESTKYFWLAAAAFGGMMSSKYLPHMIGITAGYYGVFLDIPSNKWSVGKVRWLMFFVVIGVTFVALNPTILLPQTWHEMLTFLTEKRIGHDAYEFVGQLYPNKMTKWLNGVPWTFYFVFILVKIPLVTLILLLIGLPAFFRSKLGDGRYFIGLWAMFWFVPFALLGGKFTRYFTVGQPIVLIVAAIGFCFLVNLFIKSKRRELFAAAATIFLLIYGVAIASQASPHFRLFTNVIGGENIYFPHDEFYDLSTREAAAALADFAPSGARVANETPYLVGYYAEKAGRGDLKMISLSDKNEVADLAVGDIVLVAEGRRYFSNDEIVAYLKSTQATAVTSVNGIISTRIYQLDAMQIEQLKELSKH